MLAYIQEFRRQRHFIHLHVFYCLSDIKQCFKLTAYSRNKLLSQGTQVSSNLALWLLLLNQILLFQKNASLGLLAYPMTSKRKEEVQTNQKIKVASPEPQT